MSYSPGKANLFSGCADTLLHSSNDKYSKFVSLIFDDEHRRSPPAFCSPQQRVRLHIPLFTTRQPHLTPGNFPRLSDFRWLTLVVVNYPSSSQRRSRRHLHRPHFSDLRAFFLKRSHGLLCLTKASLESNFDGSLAHHRISSTCSMSFFTSF